MKRITTLIFFLSSILVYSQSTFDVFCSKFLELPFPIIANNAEWNNLWYFQLDKETSITKEDFQKFIQTNRWSEFSTPADSSYIYHYVPVGRIKYSAYTILFVNCGYMPQPKIYGDSDIGAYENMMYIYTQDGILIDSILFSGATSITNINGHFARKWDAKMPTWCRFATFSSDGTIALKTFYDNHLIPESIDSLFINPQTGQIQNIDGTINNTIENVYLPF
jgi:hypothetical protein